MAGQLQTEPWGRAAGAHQLHFSILRMQRSEVMTARQGDGRRGAAGQSSTDYPSTCNPGNDQSVIDLPVMVEEKLLIRSVDSSWPIFCETANKNMPFWSSTKNRNIMLTCFFLFHFFNVILFKLWCRCGEQGDVRHHAECWNHQHAYQRVHWGNLIGVFLSVLSMTNNHPSHCQSSHKNSLRKSNDLGIRGDHLEGAH